MDEPHKSRAAFVVFKVHAANAAYYLLRVNRKWKDLNLLGGHEKGRDRGNLQKAARRELWEEVPSLRKIDNIELEPLTRIVQYGPIHSLSQNRNTEYELQFFLVKLEKLPELSAMTGTRSKNVLVPESDLLKRDRIRVSGLIDLLTRHFRVVFRLFHLAPTKVSPARET